VEDGITGEDPETRRASIIAWRRLFPEGNPQSLEPSLRDIHPEVRRTAATSLATLENPSGGIILATFLAGDEEGQEAVLEGIAGAGGKAVLSVVGVIDETWPTADRGRLLAKGLDGDAVLEWVETADESTVRPLIVAAGPRLGPALVVGWDRADGKQKDRIREWISLCGWDRRAITIINGRDTGERRALYEMIGTRDKRFWYRLFGDALGMTERKTRRRVRRVLKSVSRRQQSADRNPPVPDTPGD
jgi:hypothetical protein